MKKLYHDKVKISRQRGVKNSKIQHIIVMVMFMLCRIDELKNKQVVCMKDGCVLGFVSDIEMDTESGALTSIVIFGRTKFLGLLGHEEDITIPWSDIKVIGNETILVDTEPPSFLPEKAKRIN